MVTPGLTAVLLQCSTSVFRHAPVTVTAVTVPSVCPGTADHSLPPSPLSSLQLPVVCIPFYRLRSAFLYLVPSQLNPTTATCARGTALCPEASGSPGDAVGTPPMSHIFFYPCELWEASPDAVAPCPQPSPPARDRASLCLGQAGWFQVGMPRRQFTYCQGCGDRCPVW